LIVLRSWRSDHATVLGVAFLTLCFFAGQASAADQAEQGAIAKSKAGALEQKAVVKGSTASPARAETISTIEAQAVDPIGGEPTEGAATCLARTLYWEAKGEGDAGMHAVANVVMNRLRHKGFPKTICGVVKQGHEQGACQFSWWCDGQPDTAEEPESYTHAKEIGRQALNQQLDDRTNGALYYHRRDATPSWAREYIRTAEVGGHVFYKPADGEAK
jgi:spore germination cell wall hydrolase CwlJ-like protein